MAGIALKKHNAKGHIVSGIARRRTDRTGWPKNTWPLATVSENRPSHNVKIYKWKAGIIYCTCIKSYNYNSL
jgi:hypothetical protein